MASFGQSFVAEELPQSNNYDPVPEGWYNVVVHSAELKPTKDGSGQYINIRYDITGPTHQGRVIYDIINIKNKSSQAEEIGRQQLGNLMRSIGLAKVDDTDELIGGNIQIKVGIRQQEGYEPTNNVKGYKALSGSIPTQPKVETQDSSSSKAAPPWAKK